MKQVTVGTRVLVRDAYLDEEMTKPVFGTIEDVFSSPEYYSGQDVFVVMFEHDHPGLPPGGEFSSNMLVPVPA